MNPERRAVYDAIRQARDLAMIIEVALVVMLAAWSPALAAVRRRWPQVIQWLVLGGGVVWGLSLVLLIWCG